MQVFTWDPRIDLVGQTSFRVLTAQFGDGYAQRAGDGIHAKGQSWPLEFAGEAFEIRPIRAFLDAHEGFRAVLWTPPMGEQSSFVAPEGYTLKAHGADFFTLSVTFKEAARP